MQTLGHIYLLDRNGIPTQCIHILYRISKYSGFIKLRKASKNLGVHFEAEQNALQSKRFKNEYIELDITDDAAESIYQNYVNRLLNGETIGF